jgi:hypothetical protein
MSMPDMPRMPGRTTGAMTPEERDALRERRYQAMRERAKQQGVELPETPPWQLMSNEERQAHREKMRRMTPEERQSMREEHWKQLRARAQEKGIEMPETPPWKQAEQRRQEMKARWDSYREIIDALTPEQKEAVQAVFGQGQRRFSAPQMGNRMPPGMNMQAPCGRRDRGFLSGPGTPSFGDHGAAPPAYSWGRGGPLQGAEKPVYPGPGERW